MRGCRGCATVAPVAGDKPNDQRFLQTMQVRVRRKNPLIDRRAPVIDEVEVDDDPTAAVLPPEIQAARLDPMIDAPMTADHSEVASSIYERLEQTDRSDELAEAQAELESALEAFSRDSADNLPAALPRAAPSLEETKTYMGPPQPSPAPVPPRAAPPRSSPAPRSPPPPRSAEPASVELTPAQPVETERVVPQRLQADRAVTAIEAPAPLDRAATQLAPARLGRAPGADPTTRRRAGPRRANEARLDTEPTPVAAPRVSNLLDDDETVLAGAPPRAGHTRTAQDEPGIRLVRKPRSAPPQPAAPPAEIPAARPRNRLALLGTDAAGEVMKEHALQALGGSLPKLDTPALKLVRAELSDASLGVLQGILHGSFDGATSDPGASSKRAFERLINDKHYGRLTPKEQAALLRSIASSPDDVTTIKAAIALLKTGVAGRLNQRDRQALLHLFGGLDAEARVRIAQLGARKLRGLSALEDRDLQDQTLVTHLEHLVHGRGYSPLLEARGVSRQKSVSIVLGAVAHPERLSFEEGSAGVLGMLEFGLADTTPAEYARLWRHLAFDEMIAPLAGPAALDLRARLAEQPEIEMSGANTPLRVALQLLAELARPIGRSRKPTFIMPGGHGIDADVVSRALELLFGFGFTVAAGAANAGRHLQRIPPQSHRLPPVFVTVLYARGERLFLFDHMDEDWVYLRAPRGRSTKQRGALRIDPKREVVDPDGALDRIPKEGFDEKVGVGLIPRL